MHYKQFDKKCSCIFHINMKLPDITVPFIVSVPRQSSVRLLPPHPSLRLLWLLEGGVSTAGELRSLLLSIHIILVRPTSLLISCHELLVPFLLQNCSVHIFHTTR